MQNNSTFLGQFILVGTVVCEGYNPRVAKGARCPMISIVDCDELSRTGRLNNYVIDDGLNAGAMLDDTLGQYGWCDISIKSALPIAQKEDGWEPEIAALILTAKKIGIAHMVFEPEARPSILH
jgi:hypothetical protein